MGQHTWFFKSKQFYLKQKDLYEKLYLNDIHEISLNDDEILQIERQIDEIDEENNIMEYHDLFRTYKRNEDGTDTDDVIFSREECFQWITNPKNRVSFKAIWCETDEQEKMNREYCLKKINNFWNNYPDGVIYFA